jgi:hypothetical protein
MSDEIDQDRRRFLSTTAMAIAAAHLGMTGSTQAQSNDTTPAANRHALMPVMYSHPLCWSQHVPSALAPLSSLGHAQIKKI